MNQDEKLFIQCDCSGEVLLTKAVFDCDEQGKVTLHELWFACYRMGTYNGGFWSRIKMAWKFFRTGYPYQDQVCINPEDAAKLKEFLNKHF